MKLKIYQVDAFADGLFTGNPAAVCSLTEFLADDLMQSIAAENNLSETAFFVKKGDGYHIRWFTPECEEQLCGHATLASAFVIFNYIDLDTQKLSFESMSGPLHVEKRADGLLELNFPAVEVEEMVDMPLLVEALGTMPKKIYRSKLDYLAVFDDEAEVRELQPDFNKMDLLDLRGVIASSRSQGEFDFVSRYFAPKCSVHEDPVTGSAHCILAPYWASQLGKNILKAKQISKRGGVLLCEVEQERVRLAGNAVLYMEGELVIA